MSTEDRITQLEARLRLLEDERDIAQLIASYGPLVDAGAAEEVAALWTETGVYDVDEIFMEGRDQIAAMVSHAPHQDWIAGGCAHFLGPVHVVVTGDTAIASGHSLMIVRDEGRFVVRRATANHWELVRTTGGWQVTRRTTGLLDGREASRTLLKRGVLGLEPSPR